jgi:type IV secretory pathway VirB2 component (pilin)
MFKNYKLLYSVLALVLVLFNASAASASPFEDAVCTILTCFLGNGIVLVIATGAVLFLGIGAFFGKVSWGVVILTVVAIIAVAGAEEIAGLFIGGQDGCPAATGDECDFSISDGS